MSEVRIFKDKNMRIPLGRGVMNHTDTSGKCLCYRDKAHVFCNSCGFYGVGRLNLKCTLHPHVVFLFDLTHCPQCKVNSFMMREI